jgi:hypothetical protein
MKLIEFLESPLKWHKQATGVYNFEYNNSWFIAKFAIQDVADAINPEFGMEMGYDPEDSIASFVFGPNNGGSIKFAMTGKGGGIQIFSTIREIIHDYVKENRRNVIGIIFVADLHEPTRVRLYKRMLPKIAQEINVTPHDLGTSFNGKYHEFFLEF